MFLDSKLVSPRGNETRNVVRLLQGVNNNNNIVDIPALRNFDKSLEHDSSIALL